MKHLKAIVIIAMLVLVSCTNQNERINNVVENNHDNIINEDKEIEVENIQETVESELELIRKMKQVKILDGSVKLVVPESFELLDEEIAKVKYPNGNRPPIIYSNERATVNIAINHTTGEAKQDLMMALYAQIKTTLNENASIIEWIEEGVSSRDGYNFGYLVFMSEGIDTNIYNHMFFTDLDDRLLVMSFNCTEELQEEWLEISKVIMESIDVQR